MDTLKKALSTAERVDLSCSNFVWHCLGANEQLQDENRTTVDRRRVTFGVKSALKHKETLFWIQLQKLSRLANVLRHAHGPAGVVRLQTRWDGSMVFHEGTEFETIAGKKCFLFK